MGKPTFPTPTQGQKAQARWNHTVHPCRAWGRYRGCPLLGSGAPHRSSLTRTSRLAMALGSCVAGAVEREALVKGR